MQRIWTTQILLAVFLAACAGASSWPDGAVAQQSATPAGTDIGTP